MDTSESDVTIHVNTEPAEPAETTAETPPPILVSTPVSITNVTPEPARSPSEIETLRAELAELRTLCHTIQTNLSIYTNLPEPAAEAPILVSETSETETAEVPETTEPERAEGGTEQPAKPDRYGRRRLFF